MKNFDKILSNLKSLIKELRSADSESVEELVFAILQLIASIISLGLYLIIVAAAYKYLVN